MDLGCYSWYMCMSFLLGDDGILSFATSHAVILMMSQCCDREQHLGHHDADFASVSREISETTPYRNRNLRGNLYCNRIPLYT